MLKKMSVGMNAKFATLYALIICNFVCSYKSNFDTHLSTLKHKKMVINGNTPSETPDPTSLEIMESLQCEHVNNPTNVCKYCNKHYSHPSALSRHKKTCKNMLMNQQQHFMDNKYDMLIGLLQTMNSSSDSIKQTIGSNSSVADENENVKVCVSDFQNTLVDATKCIRNWCKWR